MSGVNIASYLVEMARRQPGTDALLTNGRRDGSGKWSYHHTTFAELNGLSDKLARGMAGLGVGVGARVALCLRPGVDFFAVTFGLFKLGAVPVLIDPGIGVRNFGRCLGQARPEVFVGEPLAHVLRKTLGWARATVKTTLTTGGFGGISLRKMMEREERGGAVAGEPVTLAAGAKEAAILFTSGSTGPAKGVLYTHENFDAQIGALKRTYAIEPGEIDLATFPLFALFGPALGMTTVLPEMNFTRPGFVDPRNIIEPIQQLGITNMFGSPALLARVSRYGEERGVKLPSLRRVISAGAPASAPVLERFSKILSAEAEIFTPYGATEALPVCSIGSREILRETRALTDQGRGVCVGRPVEEIRVRIINITDKPIANWSEDIEVPAGKIGEIVVQGPAVTTEYFENPSATHLAKISCKKGETRNSGHENFFHRMGDLGYFDPQGRLWFCGRKSQRVRLPERDLFTIPAEAIFNTHPNVARSALVCVERTGVAEPVICIELKEGLAQNYEATRTLTEELLNLAKGHEATRFIKHVLYYSGFPVDIRHNAKINREKLAHWAQRKLA